MRGRFKVVVEGKNPDYFIRELIKNKICIYDLKKEYKKLTIVISENDFEKLKTIKTSYKYYVVNCYGAAKVKYLIKKYLFFLICLVLGIGLNIFFSNLILDVEVIHSNSYIRKLVYNDLDEFGISKYKFKVDFFKKEDIVMKILEKEKNDIEWLEIEEVGIKYVVKVEQRKKDSKNDVCVARNIVASKDAMILEIQADIGEVVKKKYDYVKKGDIVISGLIHNKDEIMSKRCATGKVFGEVWYKVDLEIPMEYREENVTGRVKSQLEFNFFDKNFSFFNDFNTYKKYSKFLIGSRLLPIAINFSKYLETNIVVHNYNISNVDKFALELAEVKIKQKLGNNGDIVSKKVLKKNIKNSKIIVKVFIKVKEDITGNVEIVDIGE